MGGGNTSQVQDQVQSGLERDAVSNDFLIDSANNSVIMAGETDKENDKEVNDDVVVVEDSPTVFNERKLPKTVRSNQFISLPPIHSAQRSLSA